MPNQHEDPIELFWEDLGITPRKNLTPDELREAAAPNANRNDLVIATRNQLLVVIRPDGTLEYGPNYTPDAAALVFWEAMARRRQNYEERMLLYAHIEQLLMRVGQQDAEYERQSLRALEENLEPHEKAQRDQYAELARRRLEMEVHSVIELARGLIRREGD
jgi:hypothetical protein